MLSYMRVQCRPLIFSAALEYLYSYLYARACVLVSARAHYVNVSGMRRRGQGNSRCADRGPLSCPFTRPTANHGERRGGGTCCCRCWGRWSVLVQVAAVRQRGSRYYRLFYFY